MRPVEITGFGKADGGEVTVVVHLRWSLVGTSFHEEDSQPTGVCAADLTDPDASASERCEAGVGEWIVWQSRDEVDAGSEQRQGYGCIGLCTGKRDIESSRECLCEPEHSRWCHSGHDFSEGHDVSHEES